MLLVLIELHFYLPIIHVNFISKYHERKMIRISWTRLYQKLITPWIQIFKWAWWSDVVHKYATISASIKSHTQRLKTFLSSSIPNLRTQLFNINSCNNQLNNFWNVHTCIVTTRSSAITSFVQKSAPIVALYWFENRLFIYWFMSDVFPTLLSPRMITFSKDFLRVAISAYFDVFVVELCF